MVKSSGGNKAISLLKCKKVFFGGIKSLVIFWRVAYIGRVFESVLYERTTLAMSFCKNLPSHMARTSKADVLPAHKKIPPE